MKRMKFFKLLTAALVSMSAVSCSFFGSDDDDDIDPVVQQQNVATPQLLSINLAGAIAIGGTDGSSGSRAINDASIVKIMADGTVENLITIPDGYNGTLASVKAIYQSHVSAGKEIYIVFDGTSWFSKDDKGISLSPLLCVKEDGTYVDVLNPTGSANNETNYWISTWDNQDCMWFDQNGYAFFLVGESSGGQSSQMIYRFDPKTNSLLQLVPAVSGINYSKVMVSRDGNWIFAQGSRYSSNSSAIFLRAIPVSNPDNPINLIYFAGAGLIESWHYDDKTGKILVTCRLDGSYPYLYEFSKQAGNTYSTNSRKIIFENYLSSLDYCKVIQSTIAGRSDWGNSSISPSFYSDNYDYRIDELKTDQEILSEILKCLRYRGDVDFRLDVIAKETGCEELNVTVKNVDAVAWLRSDMSRVRLLMKCLKKVCDENPWWYNEFEKLCFIKDTDRSAIIFQSLAPEGNVFAYGNFMGNGKGSIWGCVRYSLTDNNYSQKMSFVKFTDFNGNYVFEIPTSLDTFKPTSYVIADDSFYFSNSILVGGVESGYQDIYRCTSDGQLTNMFQNVPSNNTLEVTSFSTNGDMLYYSGVRGTQTVSGRINTRTLSHETLNISKKLTSIIVLK